MLHVKKNDIVSVIAGKDKGKKGKILKTFSSKNRAVVENINMIKKTRRRTQQNQQGGIIEIEVPINMSNLMLFCKQCNKPARVKVDFLKDGSKVRKCKKCEAVV